MTGNDIFFLISAVLGGLALFIFGMNIMTKGLRGTTGSRLRTVLAKSTRSRFAGIGLGTLIGFLVQSSAGTVMVVGFANAGLMTLAQSVPPMLGINIGTTLSMQLISLKLGTYCYFVLALGFLIYMVIPHGRGRQFGYALLGFGLLFLGMNVMSDAIRPYREFLVPYVAHVDGSTLGGMMAGVGLATAVTGIIQSSGAMIGMVFVMISSGVINDLQGAYPIIIGANVGTCVTALLGSIGTNLEARRSAVSHLVFNIMSAVLGIVAAPLFYKYIPMTADNTIHQAANANTVKMAISALLVLPFSRWHARVVETVLPGKRQPWERSFLDHELLDRPERAIYASIRELQRMARICLRSLRLDADLLFTHEQMKVRRIKLNEEIIDEIKVAMREYFSAVTEHYLSKRQAILIQHVDRCVMDIERVGDHIDAMCDLSERHRRIPRARFSHDMLERVFALYESASKVLKLVTDSLNPENKRFQATAAAILESRDEYMRKSIETRRALLDKTAAKEISSIGGVFFSEYIGTFDRIVKHAKIIALVEQRPEFWIKRKKLDRIVGEAPENALPPPSDPQDFLDRLQYEDYL